MRLVVCIPTYWTRAEGWRDGDVVFDHPTPLDQEGTLERCLRSIRELGDHDLEVLLVEAVAHPALADAAAAQIAEIVQRAALPVACHRLGLTQIDALLAALPGEMQEAAIGLLQLHSYGAVRNACLAGAHMLDADAVLFIDDDEVIEDAGFLPLLRGHLRAGVDALAGIYVDSQGGCLLEGDEPEWERILGKRQAMNQAFREVIGTPPQVKPTPFAFGGNMTLSRALYSQVPFDPEIPRGEDIDYLICARAAGFTFQLDSQLRVLHLPPPHSAPAWVRLRQDGVRFVYQRDKLRGAGLEARDFDPYPGLMLRDDLEERLARACYELVARARQDGDADGEVRAAALCAELAQLSFTGTCARFVTLQQQWRALMPALARPALRELAVARCG